MRSPLLPRSRHLKPAGGWGNSMARRRAGPYRRAMETTLIDVHDDAVCARAYDVIIASKGHERPWNEPPSLAETLVEWRHVDKAERMEMWGALDGGELVGVATLWLPLTDNTTMTWFDVQVDPAHRGRGAGTALVERLRRAGPGGGSRHDGRRLPRASRLRRPRLPPVRRAARLPPQQHRDHAPPPAARRRRAPRPSRASTPARAGRAPIASRPMSGECPSTCRSRSAPS